MPRLENWCVGSSDANPYQAPELRRKVLSGVVSGHPGFLDGDEITTSALVELDLAGKKAKTRSGTLYELGEPDPKWVAWLRETYNKSVSDFVKV